MIAFGHTAVGASVGLATFYVMGDANPPLTLVTAGTAGLLSHYMTDLLPHGHFFIIDKNYKRNIVLTILFDFLLGVALFLYLGNIQAGLSLKVLSIFFGIGGAQLPDILDNLIRIKVLPNKGLFRWENKMHYETHWHGKDDDALLLSFWDLWQALIIIYALLFVASF